MFKTIRILTLLLALGSGSQGAVTLFGATDTAFTLQSAEFQPWLFVGATSDSMHPADTLTTALHLGLDFPLVSFDATPASSFSVGVASLFHLYLYPANALFNVDNFYAAFAGYLAGTIGPRFAWRLYPLYHVSAHLSDGAAVDYTVSRNKVSNEMLYATVSYLPLTGLETMIGAGWYYHTVGRRDLDARFVGACTYEHFLLPRLGLFGTVEGELVVENGVRPGIGLNAGIRLIGQSSRRMDLSLRWYNRPHLGQYYTAQEHGLGCRVVFGLGLAERGGIDISR